MSDRAQKRVADAPERPDAVDANTGLFAIDAGRRSETVLPPAGEQDELLSLEDSMIELDPDTVIELELQPARGVVSGVFSSRPRPPVLTARPGQVAEDAEMMALAGSLEPYYREQERDSERARLDVEDLSLLPGNPYSASSLVPPPAKPFPLTAFAAGAAAAAVLLTGGWLVLRGSAADPQPVPVSAAIAPARAPAVVTAPVPQAARPEAEPPVGAAATIIVAEPTVGTASAPTAAAPPPEPAPQIARPARQTTAGEPVAPRERETASPVSAAASIRNAVPAAIVETETSDPAATAAASPAAVAPAAPAVAPTVPGLAPAPVEQGAEVTAGIALPETPSREQVTAGFQAVRDQLAQCAAGKHGVAKINATIANSGRVSYALIEGEFQGTPEGSCMARAVRAARFPQFSQPNLKVSYPVAF